VNLCPLTDEPEFAEIDRDHQKVANCLQIGPAQIGTTLDREAEPLDFHDVIDILRRRKSARHVDAVIMPAQQEILAKIEILLFAMVGNLVWKPRAEAARVLQLFARA
jgi:hypothetical protein